MARVAKDSRGLTDKQARFVAEYLKDMCASKAAVRAGYSPKSARKYANELLNDGRVKAAIAEAIEARNERDQIDADWVKQQAVKLHLRCMQEIEPFTDRSGDQIYDKEGRPLFVFNATGAAKALELIGKHVGVQAFKEKIETNAPIIIAVSQEDAEL